MQKANLTTRLIKAQGAISNALKNDEILKVLTGFNYGSERLKNGYALYEEVRILAENRQKEYNEQLEATRQFNEAFNLAVEKYVFALKLARVVFKDSERANDALLLTGSRKKGFADWVAQAEPFYNNLLNDQELLSEISAYGLTAAILQENRQAMQHLVELNNRFLKEKGEAVESTRVRNEKTAELDSFMSDLQKICKLAFADRPEVLIQLGMSKA